MLISTKGRYALRVMVDLAEQDPERFVRLQEIADRQGISEKYLEGIVVKLSRAGDLVSARGKGGGYRLSRAPEAYTVLSILERIEGKLAPVSCLEHSPCGAPARRTAPRSRSGRGCTRASRRILGASRSATSWSGAGRGKLGEKAQVSDT